MSTLYRRVGRRYQPVGQYDHEVMDHMPEGAHLVVVEPGLKSVRYGVTPEHAPVLAALRMCRDKVMRVLLEKTAFVPSRPLTAKEREAWAAYCAVMGGDHPVTLTRASASDIVDAMESVLVEGCK